MQNGSEQREREICGIVEIPESTRDHDTAMHQSLQSLHERLQRLEADIAANDAAEEEKKRWLGKTQVCLSFGFQSGCFSIL